MKPELPRRAWSRLRRLLCGKLALRDAARRRDGKAVDRLLQLGCDPFEEVWERGVGFDRPITVAIATGDIPIVRRMLEGGWKTARTAARKQTDFRPLALHAAVKANHLPMVRFLLGEGARVYEYHVADAVKLDNSLMVRALAETLPSTYFSDRASAHTMLHQAVANDRVEVVKDLVGLGMNVESTNIHGRTVADVAAEHGAMAILEYLKVVGARLDYAAHGWETPLAIASANSQPAVARFLLDHGARVDGAHSSPLAEALEAGDYAMAELLIEHGANINIRGGQSSPIAVAIKAKSLPLVHLLVEGGADLGLTFDIYGGDDDSQSWVVNLVEYARHCGAADIARYLEARRDMRTSM